MNKASEKANSIVVSILGPFGDRLRKLENIEKSFLRLREEYKLQQTNYKHTMSYMEEQKRKLEQHIKQLEDRIEITQLKIDACDECYETMTATDLFQKAREDYENLLVAHNLDTSIHTNQ